MRKIYNFYWDCGYGVIDSLFVADEKDVEDAIGKEINFGEQLGKHSEVCGILEDEDIYYVFSEDEDKDFDKIVERMESIGWIGYNPLDFLRQEDSDE